MDPNELFKKYSNDEEKLIRIVSTFLYDDDKFNSLEYISSERSKMSIIHQISTESLLLKSMDLVNEEYRKLNIANMLFDDNNKLIAISKLHNEKDKVAIAKKLSGKISIKGYSSTDDIKEFLILPDLHQIPCRIALINSFSDNERKDKLIQHELYNFKQAAHAILEDSKIFANHNILSLPDTITIGLELEANGINPHDTNVFFNQLIELKPEISEWIAKTEITIHAGSEVISPILNSSPKCIQDLYFVVEIMKLLDFKVGENCGGHIHLGINFFEIDNNGCFNSFLRNQSLKNLLIIWGETEELFFKMSNPENHVTRSSAIQYAGLGNGFSASIGQSIKNFTDNGDLNFEAVCDEIKINRYKSINLLNLYHDGINTIEFRLSNSTLETSEILHNIFLYGRLMVVSKNIALHPEKYTIKLNNLKNVNVSEAEKLELLLDLLFENEAQKSIYRKRWLSVRDNEIFKLLEIDPPPFRRGDYSLRENFLDTEK